MNKSLKPKICKAEGCEKEFVPRVSTQTACSIKCAFALVQAKKEENQRKTEIKYKRENEKLAKAQRKTDNEKREALKSRREVLNDAQRIFNKYIRLRDETLPCISCGQHRNTYDAGHYRSVAAAPQLRFNEDNCHKQCVHCNQHKSGNAIEYRIGLVKKIGTQRVEALECNNQTVKWSVEEARIIKATYQEKIKQYRIKTGETT